MEEGSCVWWRRVRGGRGGSEAGKEREKRGAGGQMKRVDNSERKKTRSLVG